MSHLNALGSKFDLDVKQVKVNLGSSFKHTWYASHPQCYIPSPKVIGLLVWRRRFLKRLYHIYYGGQLDQVTKQEKYVLTEPVYLDKEGHTYYCAHAKTGRGRSII